MSYKTFDREGAAAHYAAKQAREAEEQRTRDEALREEGRQQERAAVAAHLAEMAARASEMARALPLGPVRACFAALAEGYTSAGAFIGRGDHAPAPKEGA